MLEKPITNRCEIWAMKMSDQGALLSSEKL